jgi:hypothetical protein
VITLGHDHVAAGARIAAEAKDDRGYGVSKILEEADQACRNRDAGFTLFVVFAAAASDGMPAFKRYGSSVVVTWDAENASRCGVRTARWIPMICLTGRSRRLWRKRRGSRSALQIVL